MIMDDVSPYLQEREGEKSLGRGERQNLGRTDLAEMIDADSLSAGTGSEARLY
jgi:hypothetical protein